MPEIKSLEELKALRDKHKNDLDLRSTGGTEDKIRIAVGMATCGIAAGSRETINAIVDEVRSQGLGNVAVVQTGCMGYCYAEPVVEVRIPGKPPVLYGRVDAARWREIVAKHVKGGSTIEEWKLEGVAR